MIKSATMADLPFLMYLCEQMHKESPRFSKLTFSTSRMRGVLMYLIKDPGGIVLVSDAGMLVGAVGKPSFSNDLCAEDKLFYVSPEARGTMQAVRLIKAYIERAKELGAVDIGIGSETESAGRVEELYQRLGFRRAGGNFVLGAEHGM